jgi:hypothetical protein
MLLGSSFVFTIASSLSEASFVSECIRVNIDHLLQPIPRELVEDHCESIQRAYEKYRWIDSVPESVLRNDVFPFTVLTEPAFTNKSKRALFGSYVNFIADASACVDIGCVALAVNERIWDIRDPPIVFEAAIANSLNSYGVEETWERGNGSCTSMSVFLITGLRMLGIPSRIVGVPHWHLGPVKCPLGDASPDCGNHNWVEVFVPGMGWSFIDQRRPDKLVLPLNQSWFYPEWTKGLEGGNGNHTVYAASFLSPRDLGPEYPKGKDIAYADHFPMVWDWDNHRMPAWDVTNAYKKFGSNEGDVELVIKAE